MVNAFEERLTNAAHLSETMRSLGQEDALDLFLNLVYLRGVSLRHDAHLEWDSFRQGLWDNALPQGLLDDALSTRIPFWVDERHRSARNRPPAAEGRLAMREALVALDHAVRSELTAERLALIFETVLRLRSKSLGRTAGEGETPTGVAQLMARLVATKGLVGDPACGIGNTLMEAYRCGASRLWGTDVNPLAAARALMRFDLAGIEADIGVGDALRETQQRSEGLLLQPPFGMRLSQEQRHDLLDLPFGAPSGLNADGVWLQKIVLGLSDGGRGAALLPRGTLFRRGYDQHVRESLLAAGCVESVILLPEGFLTSTQIPTCLWLFRPLDARLDSDVLLVDISTLTKREKGRSHLEPRGVNTAVELVERWRRTGVVTEEPYVARAVRASELLGVDGSFVTGRHLASPPVTIAARPQPAARLLTELRVGGFKSFGDEQRIPLAPITLIYGPNSSGKSSLLQSLLLLKQSIDADTLVTQGSLVDAGSFLGALHRHETTRALTLGITYGALDEWQAADGVPDPGLLRSIDMGFVADGRGQAQQRELRYRFGDYVVSLRRAGGDGDTADFETQLDDMEVVFRGIARGTLLYPFQAAEPQPDNREKRSRQPAQRESTGSRVASVLRSAGINTLSLQSNGLLAGRSTQMPDVAEVSPSSEQSIVRSYVRRGFALTEGIGVEVRSLLKGVTYLGPMRSAPERFHNRTPSQRGSGSDGGNFAMYLFDNSSEVEKVNEWLSNLGVPYALQVVPVGAVGSVHVVGDLVAVILTDKRSGVEVSPADVGFGISQVLPIVVEALARERSVICVEQPEIHLHPALQAQLADLLIESTAEEGRANQFLVETHSEHLVLRMQRRIRDGSLSPDRVNVIYVDQDEGGTARCSLLRLNKHGDFIDQWPHGFFEERLDEILGGWQ